MSSSMFSSVSPNAVAASGASRVASDFIVNDVASETSHYSEAARKMMVRLFPNPPKKFCRFV